MKMARISASMPGRTRAIVKVGRETLVRGLGSLNGTRAEERGCCHHPRGRAASSRRGERRSLNLREASLDRVILCEPCITLSQVRAVQNQAVPICVTITTA
jgi:hypothetical protein